MRRIMKSQWIGLITLALAMSGQSCTSHNPETGKPASPTTAATSEPRRGSIYDVALTLDDQNGQKVEWQSLKGKVRVMAMVFTHCPAACPRIAEDIKAVEHLLAASDGNASNRVGYTLISFDSKRDTAKQLLQFYTDHGLDSHWELLHASAEDVQIIANLLDVKFVAEPGGAFTHENVIAVIDGNGQIAFRREGLGKDPKEVARKIQSLIGMK